MHRKPVNAMPDFRIRVGNVLRLQALIDRLPGLAAVIRSKRTRGRDRDVDALRVRWIDHDRVQTHAARARRPVRTRSMLAQSGHLAPALAAIGGTEERGILNA